MTALPFVSDKFAANSSSFGQLPQPPLELRASQDRVSDICVRIVKRSIQERSKSVLESSPQPGDLGLACSPFALCTSSRSLGQSTVPKPPLKGPVIRNAGPPASPSQFDVSRKGSVLRRLYISITAVVSIRQRSVRFCLRCRSSSLKMLYTHVDVLSLLDRTVSRRANSTFVLGRV